MTKKELNDLLNKGKWENISIAKYESIKNKIDIENATTDAVLDAMSVIYEIPKEDLLNLDIKTFNCLLTQVNNLKNFNANKLKKTYSINGTNYSIGLKYNVLRGEFDITTDQYITFMNVLRENSECLPSILATILIPNGQRFNNGYDLLQLKENINRHMSILDGASIVFFLNSLFLALLNKHSVK